MSENTHRAAEIHYVLKMYNFWTQKTHRAAQRGHFWGSGVHRAAARAHFLSKNGVSRRRVGAGRIIHWFFALRMEIDAGRSGQKNAGIEAYTAHLGRDNG